MYQNTVYSPLTEVHYQYMAAMSVQPLFGGGGGGRGGGDLFFQNNFADLKKKNFFFSKGKSHGNDFERNPIFTGTWKWPIFPRLKPKVSALRVKDPPAEEIQACVVCARDEVHKVPIP